MELEIDVVDAFTDALFGGNPAAVIITESWLADELMQSIATENNLSETAYLVKSGAGSYHIRWFSPIREIDFCGHATLASAHVLFAQYPELDTIVFEAKAVGRLPVTRTDSGRIEMTFPNTKPEKVKIDDLPDDLLNGLSILPVEVFRNSQAYFVLCESEKELLSVQRDNALLKRLFPHDVVVTCQAESPEYDFVSRYFWPAKGGDEDPVTGSIHTGLAPFWAERLNKSELVAYQASNRGGKLYCRVREDRVIISGHAVSYLKGCIHI